MEVRNCKSCGRLYNHIGGPPICQSCRDDIEAKFIEVKDYVRANPNASVNEVAEVNEVTIKQIRQWVRDERLCFSEASGVGIECELCGKTIFTGRYCDICKTKVKNGLESALDKPKQVDFKKHEREKDRMRFLDK